MKQCNVCKAVKEDFDFYLCRGRLMARCKKCFLLDNMRRARKNIDRKREVNREYMKRARLLNGDKVRAAQWERSKKYAKNEKTKARVLLNNAVRNGTIKRPSRCSECSIECNPHGHHEDYSLPLSVVWLCSRCHGKKHRMDVSLLAPIGGPK